MPITLTDEQAAALRAQFEQSQRVAQVAHRATQIWNNPKLSDRAKALWKEQFPDETIGDYDLKNEVFGRLDKEKAEREAEAQKARDAELERQITSGRDRAKGRGLTQDAIDRMEKMMVEKGIRDYEDAMDLMAAREPRQAEETGGGEHFWRHDQQDQFKKVAEDPEKWAFGEIRAAVAADAKARGIR